MRYGFTDKVGTELYLQLSYTKKVIERWSLADRNCPVNKFHVVRFENVRTLLKNSEKKN